MSSDDGSFDELMARLKAGDQDAASRLFHEYAHRLIGVARKHLDGVIRRKVDPEDVLQSVFRTFFLRQADGRVVLHDRQSLWGMLVVITLRKCNERIKYFHAARRNIEREAYRRPSDSDSSSSWQHPATDPTPSEGAMLAEAVERLVAALSERERDIVELHLQGLEAPEISNQLGCSERTVHRILKRIRDKLERESEGGPEAPNQKS
jgi:RNA polymerase sigma-70 factor (ECF subfamily)